MNTWSWSKRSIAGGNVLTEAELRARWRDRWQGFLNRVDDAAAEGSVEDVLRDKVTIGNAERRIAGGHEGREILELLQNARDAIREGSGDSGRVYVGVYDEGVLVANTGSRFDVFDPQVEKAVTMIGETGKGDEEDDRSIGHKGVGLKSILATGDSFEIYTRPEKTSDEILGVRLSRSYLIGSVLARLGCDIDVSELATDVGDDALQGIMTQPERDASVEVTPSLKADLSKLPLFNFPVPVDLESARPRGDLIADKVNALLQDGDGAGDGEHAGDPFRTAVFVRYEDDAWRRLLEQWGISMPEEGTREAANRPAQIWRYLARGESDRGLEPETLVQLGGIDRLHLERITGDGPGSGVSERWTITRTETDAVDHEDLAHSDVTVEVSTDDESAPIVRRSFDQWAFATVREHGSRLVVNKRASTGGPSAVDGDVGSPLVRDYQLYLYYPIENTTTSTSAYPFCLHGRFRVETNRKDLSNNNLETNRAVLEEALDLIEAVATETAAVSEDATTPYGDLYPWVLLPRPTDGGVTDPSTQPELLEWFDAAIFDRLAETACVPTVDAGARPPAATLLHWDRTVLRGQRAFFGVLEEFGREQPGADEPGDRRPMPAERALASFERLPTTIRWSDRIRSLLAVQDDASATRAVAREWARTLDAGLSRREDDPPAVSCSAPLARSLVIGTVQLLVGSVDADESVDGVIEELADIVDGVYLLPCKIRDEDPDERLFLTAVERRRSPEGGHRERTRTRTVIWDVDSATETRKRPPIPPEQTNFTVYFLDEAVQDEPNVLQVLSVSGRLWGLRAYDGFPSYFRSLLDTFADGERDVIDPIDFAFLVAIIDRLDLDSADLQAGEGDFFPLARLRRAMPKAEQRPDLNRRVGLRECALRLESDDKAHAIAERVLGDDWQRLRSGAAKEPDDDPEPGAEPEVDDEDDWLPLAADDYPVPTWDAPESDAWESIRRRVKRSITDDELARTISLLGASTLPNVRILWAYGNDHPRPRTRPPWDPQKWTGDQYDGRLPEAVDSLQGVLASHDGAYQRLLTAPEYHPADSGDHSSKCSVKLDRTLDQVILASWVWIDDVDAFEASGETLIELLRRHGDQLVSSLLRTGWSCNNGHKRRAWDRPVPSLLNWQLRQLRIWGALLETDEGLRDDWGEETERLRYAVRLESTRGAQAARLFPHLTESARERFSGDVLDALGVKPVDELNATEAADHLQQLLSILAEDELRDDRPVRLAIPTDRTNDWSQAYTALLQPLLKRLSNEDGEEPADWPFLTHLPLREGKRWVAAPIDWITRHADEQIRYYQDRSPKPWERYEVEKEDFFVLPQPTAGAFASLAQSLGVEKVDASKLILDPGEDDLEFVGDRYTERLDGMRTHLLERRDLLIASTERTDEAEVTETAADLTAAIRDLDVVEQFPDRARRQLSDPTSALYRTAGGTEALVLDESVTDDPTLDDLAMGVALLVEQPTKVATFREALRTDLDVRELERRWEQLTFPIQPVKTLLGSHDTRRFEERVDALSALVERVTGDPLANRDEAVTSIGDADAEVREAAEAWLATGTEPDPDRHPGAAVASLVEQARTRLPDNLEFVLDHLLGSRDRQVAWPTAIERADCDASVEIAIIRWLDDHRRVVDSHPFDPDVRERYARLLVVRRVWQQTDGDRLDDVDTWATRIAELRSDERDVAWTSELEPSVAEAVDCPPRLFFLAVGERLTTVTQRVLDEIGSGLEDDASDVLAALRGYVERGERPDPGTDRGAADHQERAFADLTSSVTSDGGVDFVPSGDSGSTDLLGARDASLNVSSGSQRGGGGSSQFRGRGQQAEAFVMAGVLDRAADWLEENPSGVLRQLRSGFKRLHRDQRNAEYSWHLDSVWEESLLPLLDDPEGLTESMIVDWRSWVEENGSLTDHPLVELINVTMEHGPGFDVIDPFGPLESTRSDSAFGLDFAPVEVKAVDGTEPPFRFRLTTNEYRQCKAFVRDSDAPYVIRLVSVPEAGTANWPAQSTVAMEQAIDSVDELDAMVAERGFERVVKGGYMNLSVE